MSHKSGFVAIVGKPNAGKSTLMNAFLGQDLTMVNPKAQTTRHRIKGILNGDDYQVIFSDTPGVIEPIYKLHEKMMGAVNAAFEDADVLLYITEIADLKLDDLTKAKLTGSDVPLFVVLNKVDVSNQEQIDKAIAHWQETLNPEHIFPVSALRNFYLDVLLKHILEKLPEGPAYFDKDDSLSDRDTRFFVEEIIRERILSFYQKEIPYSVEVKVMQYKESEDIDRIYVTLFVTRESQKIILLGKGGAAIKKLGTESRKKIEAVVNKKVFLELTVKVEDNWRDDERQLKRFGYE
ncbi:MAG: GTPase Era [Bacteroidota bacterium]